MKAKKAGLHKVANHIVASMHSSAQALEALVACLGSEDPSNESAPNGAGDTGGGMTLSGPGASTGSSDAILMDNPTQ